VPTRLIAELHPNPDNPRGPVDPATVAELAASIREKGILQPLLITPDGTVVAGHRRLAAAILAGLEEVPIIERAMGPSEQLEVMLIENIQREDLSPLQEARAYERLMQGGLVQAQIARRIGITTARVQSRLPILKLEPEVQELYGRNELPTIFAASLARVTDRHQQLRFANIAARRQMPTGKLELLIKRSLGELEERATVRTATEPLVSIVQSATRLDLLQTLRREGETTISFDDLARVLEETCCWCGMGDVGDGDVCKNCPVPQLVSRVVGVA
jgi:ParB family chromosome partitioning protein